VRGKRDLSGGKAFIVIEISRDFGSDSGHIWGGVTTKGSGPRSLSGSDQPVKKMEGG